MTDDLQVRLVGARTPDGEIRARDLAVLADALQELRLRLGRELINTAGPGRTRHYMEESTSRLSRTRYAAITSMTSSRATSQVRAD